jgi:spermidine/putrescine transport system permease protein
VERYVRAHHPALVSARARRRLAPYLLSAPGGLWLLVFFVIPIATMLVLSLETPIATRGFVQAGYRFTWNVAIYAQGLAFYHSQLFRSVVYGALVTVATLVVGYPVAYWIAFSGGRWKNAYLFLLLLPFFVSFVIRTLVWEFILSDAGFVLTDLRRWHLLPARFHVLSTPEAVIAGISYNALPFMILPLYVSLEKIDRTVVEAAKDLYATSAAVLTRVILPLSVPGIFAGILLTFVPAVGDYVNASILGGTGTTMIGNVIQYQYLTATNYPMAAALSFTLMLGLLVAIVAYARVLGTRQLEEYL